jgi:hypothetical protein
MSGMRWPILACVLTGILVAAAGCSGRVKHSIEQGRINGNTYANDFFGLSIEVPAGWQIASPEMKEQVTAAGEEVVAGNNPALKSAVRGSKKTTYYLLMTSQHPMGAAVAFNSNYSLMAEDISAAPGVKTGKDYLSGLQQFMSQSQMSVAYTQPPYECKLAGETFHRLDARVTLKQTTVDQCYIVTIRNGYALALILSWTDPAAYQTMEKSIQTLKLQ